MMLFPFFKYYTHLQLAKYALYYVSTAIIPAYQRDNLVYWGFIKLVFIDALTLTLTRLTNLTD